MLKYYVKEFVAVGDYLKKSGAAVASGAAGSCYCINRDKLSEILDKNAYDTVHNKLTYWKALKWIDTEEDRFTKKVYNRNTGLNERCINVNITVYETLKHITKEQ